MSSIWQQLKSKLIVSCQAAPGDILEDTDAIRRMALAAVNGGAAGLRINSAEHIAALRRTTNLPIIGIQKKYIQGKLHITPDFESAQSLAQAGASIIALDCTDREWPEGSSYQQLIARIHAELHLPVMADIATFEEALAAADAGADCVGTTLNGYTPSTCNNHGFSWDLLARLKQNMQCPIMAEGHLSTPEEARRAIEGGAWCTIIGSAITRPGVITASFIKAIEHKPEAQFAVGADIGGTSIKAALVTSSGEVLHSSQVPTVATEGRVRIAANLLEAIRTVLASASQHNLHPVGIGIASAGAIREDDGSVFAATDNLPGWAGFPLQSFVETSFHLPTRVVNDAQAAVLAELEFGQGRGITSFAAITLGTGVGGGIVVNGKLLRGQHGFAGSIGHHVIHAGGRTCNCGRTGCLEAYVSTAALLRNFEKAGGKCTNADVAARAFEINQLAQKRDTAARKAYDVLGEDLAEGIANLMNLFDPQLVLLSGGLIEGQAEFVANVQKRVTELLHFGTLRAPQIQVSEAGLWAGVQGAASLIFHAL
jgi:putative N-acetylmannosamine-6-phosphate epimerase/predicted NBD/HSP70 family sugar kinase